MVGEQPHVMGKVSARDHHRLPDEFTAARKRQELFCEAVRGTHMCSDQLGLRFANVHTEYGVTHHDTLTWMMCIYIVRVQGMHVQTTFCT